LNYLDKFSKNTQVPNFMQFRPAEAELHAVGQRAMTKQIVTFRNFAKAPKKDELTCFCLHFPSRVRACQASDTAPEVRASAYLQRKKYRRNANDCVGRLEGSVLRLGIVCFGLNIRVFQIMR
jgi:hypothetical protein